LADADDHQARARAFLVLADGFHFGARFDLARPWYDKTRFHAAEEGDESAISAMLHNIAAFRASNLKLADALGAQLEDEARHAAMQTSSAAAYDRAIGTKSFEQFIPHVTAQVHMIEKRYQAAKSVLAKIDPVGLPRRVHAVHYVDLAICALHLGEKEQLEEMLRLAERSLETEMDGDDVVYTNCRLASNYSALGDQGLADRARVRAKEELVLYRSVQVDLVDRLLRVTQTIRR
jgi:hypothetical protein